MTTPSVAVLGTGPSGLAAAKALLEQGIQPLIFESAAQLGGMWAAPGRGAWSDFARTNISRYSNAFSDLAWPADTEVFPIRREFTGYLRLYADTFGLTRHIQFNTRVELIRPSGDGRWRLHWQNAGSAQFDHVVIANGIFTAPCRPRFPGLEDFAGEVTHSATCHTTADLRARFSGRRVLVVGAAFSGTEIAAELAPYARVTVTFRHPMWFVPRWIQPTEDSPLYPFDLAVYNRHPDNPLRREPHRFLHRIGGDPGAASPELAFDAEPPMTIIISDDFLDLVRSGRITPKRSATLHLDATGVTFADATRQPFDAVILCAGYTASLPFFDQTALNTMGFDPADQLQPDLLHRDMFHPDLPGIAFIGHYRGPYFPIMELQSRWLARILAGDQPMPDRATMLAGIAEERVTRARFPRPQFPHGDFVSLADALAREIGVYPTLPANDPLQPRITEGPVVAAQYRLTGPRAKPTLARKLVAETPAPGLDDAPSQPARRILNLFRGQWSIDRHIEPGGHFTGEATFTPHTTDSLLYHETGRLVLDNGTALNGENTYIYALSKGGIEVTFADGSSKGGHFVTITIPDDLPDELPITSIDRHLCRLDTYDATVRIESPTHFTITYVVKGPTKAYTSHTTYYRPKPIDWSRRQWPRESEQAGTAAAGINDAGQVAGYYSSGTGISGFVDTNGSFTAINDPAAENGYTLAYGINDV